MRVFEEYGNVSNAKIITNKYNERSKRFGFVIIDDSAVAEAIKEQNGTTRDSRNVVVNQVDERK